MTTRNLDALFAPRSIALIGASNTPGSVGEALASNLLQGGFEGPILPVNPRASAIHSALAYATIADLPQAPDLAVIATPPATIPSTIEALAQRGCRACVVITAGLDAQAKAQMLTASRPTLMRILGPNCLGFLSPGRGINASFARTSPQAGGLALVSQSGAVAAAAIDWACGRQIGFSHVASIGDALDIDVADLLDYLALDPQTKAILLYVESLSGARKFMSAARIAARAKPVVVIKAGRSPAGAKAAFSHTGALAGADAVYDAAFRRAGMLRVEGLRELFDAAATLSAGHPPLGERLAIITNGGGAGVMAADALAARGGALAPLSEATRSALDQVLPPTWSHGDPIDIIGDAPPDRYAATLDIVLADETVDAVLVMNCPTAIGDSTEAARAVIEVTSRARRRPSLLTCWLGETSVAEGRRLFASSGVPTYETPDEAIAAFDHLVGHRRNQALLMRTPAAPPALIDFAKARAILAEARKAGRATLDEDQARALLAACGVPIVETRLAANPAEAAAAAAELGGRVALKIRSRDLSHKTDVGGVELDVAVDKVEAAAERMLARVREAAPTAVLQGFSLQPMIDRPLAQELLAGVARDPTFGPIVMFGQGGVAVETLADRAVGLPPLDDVLARDMIEQTRVARLLHGFRDRAPADLAAVSDVLVRLSRIAGELPDLQELDINPLLADHAGVIALDVRVGLAPEAAPASPCAISPYPDDLVQQVRLDRGLLTIRPIRPQDAPSLIAMVGASTPEDVRLRFGTSVKRMPYAWAARLSQIDYDREMAFVAEAGDGTIEGVSRLAADPEGESAEFALMVRSDAQNQGLGRLLLEFLLRHAQSRGLRRVWGDVGRDNAQMLDLLRASGFGLEDCEDAARVKAVRVLAAGPPAA